MTFECGKNMLINPDPNIVNTRGCGPLMKYWFRRGFWVNIVMSLFGILVGVYMIFVSQRNRKEFIQLRDEADDRKRIIRTHSMGSIGSGNNNSTNTNQTKTDTQRYRYTGLPSSEGENGYDSDNNSSTGFHQPRPIGDPNA
jgi:hypothetical protein